MTFIFIFTYRREIPSALGRYQLGIFPFYTYVYLNWAAAKFFHYIIKLLYKA